MGKNILIPGYILEKTINLLHALDIESNDDCFIRYDYHSIVNDLIWIRQKNIVRDAYKKITGANTDKAKDEARSLYLKEKQFLKWYEEQVPF